MSQIITAPLSASRFLKCDGRWLITRKPADIRGIIHVPALAPSPSLFSKYLQEWKDKVPPSQYWPAYEDAFRREMQNPAALDALRAVWQHCKQGKTVALLCFCKKPDFCHRSIVGGFLREKGLDVLEYVPSQTEMF